MQLILHYVSLKLTEERPFSFTFFRGVSLIGRMLPFVEGDFTTI